MWIDRVEVVAELDQEEGKSGTIVFATVHRIHEPTFTAYCCNNAKKSQPLLSSEHISLTKPAPAMLPFICLVEDTFVNIDDSFSLYHILNVVSSSQLPLQLSLLFVVSIVDRLDFLVRHA